MHMQLAQQKIQALRAQRAWSQQHLAEACGVSLRTIQRLEKSGRASPETAQALAAVFSTKVTSLQEDTQVKPQRKMALPVISVLLCLISALVGFNWVYAKPIMLGVNVSANETHRAMVHLLAYENDEAEIQIDTDMKATFRPSITKDGHVFIAVQLFLKKGERYQLVSSPALVTEFNQQASIRYDEGGMNWVIDLTPKN